jgi:hypothetical protein
MNNLVEMQYFKNRVFWFFLSYFCLLFVLAFEANGSLFGSPLVAVNVWGKK